MKQLLILLVLAVSVTGCSRFIHQVSGSGNRQTQKRDVGTFTRIRTDGAFEIEVVCQQPPSLEVEADDNLLPLINTTVSGDTLTIKSNSTYSTSRPVRVKIGMANLQSVYSNGAGKIEITKLDNDNFDIDVNGAPTVVASGKTDAVDIKANGAATIDTHKLRAARANVHANGASSVVVRADQELDIVVNGPSRVTYDGDAEVKRTIHGPGKIEKRASSGS